MCELAHNIINNNMDKKDMIDFLYSHFEYEHIEMDIFDAYRVHQIEDLTDNQLEKVADSYGYND